MSFLDYIKSILCKKILIENLALKDKVDFLNGEINDLIKLDITCNQLLEKKNDKIDVLKEQLKELKETILEPIIYSPKKTITHSWTFEKKNHQVPLQDFIQPNLLAIHELLKKKHLYIKDKSELDSKAPKIVNAMKGLMQGYRFDSTSFGKIEKWLTPMEAINFGYDDCEGFAGIIVSGLIASNPSLMIPRVFSVGGMAFNGVAHQTVSITDSEGTKRHLNSTSPFTLRSDLKNYDEFGERGKDTWNLESVWWAFNNIVAFNLIDEENIDSFIYEFDSKKPDPIQLNEYTEFKAMVIEKDGITRVKQPIVDIEGKNYVGNNAGVVSFRIPDSLMELDYEKTMLTVKVFREGFKDWVQEMPFEEGKTTSRLVKLYRG